MQKTYPEFSSADEKYDGIVAENGYKAYMRLKIKSVTASDYGTFGCTAKNSFGESNATIKVYGEFLVVSKYVNLTFLFINKKRHVQASGRSSCRTMCAAEHLIDMIILSF